VSASPDGNCRNTGAHAYPARLLPYLNGRHTIDEIVYREEMRRRELRALLGAFKDDVLTFVHP
jgi:hypothetical protein